MTGDPVRVMDFRGTYKGGGGPDKTILNSAAQHNSARVHVLVTYLRQSDDQEFQIATMARALGINYLDIIDRSVVDLGCIRQLKQVIQREKISLIHSHDDKTLLYSVILKYSVPGLRLMHTCHSHSEYAKESFQKLSSYWKYLLRKKILVWLMGCHMSPILTISENTKNRLIQSGLSQKDVVVIYNGIDIDYWQRCKAYPILKNELGLSGDQLLVGTVARISYDKDLPTFFAVAQNVSREMPEVKFVIVGDGNGDELLKAQKNVESRGLQDVIFFTGHRTDLLDVYASFDIFLMTSLTEGLPNTLLEAMALQVPVVSTIVGGVPELVVNKESGILHPIGDVKSLAKSICTLLQQSNIRKEMAQEGRKRIEEKFSFSNRVSCLEDFYLEFAGK